MSKGIRVLFVAHDAYRTGATIFLLNMLRWMKRNADFDFEVALRGKGEMVDHFAELAPTHVLMPPTIALTPLRRVRNWLGDYRTGSRVSRSSLTALLKRGQFDVLYMNTITLGDQLAALDVPRPALITHVHELPSAIRKHARGQAPLVVRASYALVCVSDVVRERLIEQFPDAASKAIRIYGFVPDAKPADDAGPVLRQRLLSPMGIAADAWVIGFCGNAGLNKGADLVVPFATLIPSTVAGRPVHFVWVGLESPEYAHITAEDEAGRAGVSGRVHFVGETDRPMDWIACFDVHVMLSREDSFPLVVMEAAVAQVPTLAFANAGGAAEFIGPDAGRCVPYLNLPAMAQALEAWLSDPAGVKDCGQVAQRRVLERHTAEAVLPQIVKLIEQTASAAPRDDVMTRAQRGSR